MTPEEVEALVRKEIELFHYEPPEPGTTLGRPWSTEKVQGYVQKLRGALVKPYLQNFIPMDTYEQIQEKKTVQYWVVAEFDGHCEFYDPDNNEFGLAEMFIDKIPQTIGVRGDLVSTFCAY